MLKYMLEKQAGWNLNEDQMAKLAYNWKKAGVLNARKNKVFTSFFGLYPELSFTKHRGVGIKAEQFWYNQKIDKLFYYNWKRNRIPLFKSKGAFVLEIKKSLPTKNFNEFNKKHPFVVYSLVGMILAGQRLIDLKKRAMKT